MVYTIGQMAEKMQVAPSTLRYYDKEGLLPFVERSESGIRMFKDEDIEWLLIIECLKKTGMPIKEIKVFIDWCLQGDSTIAERKQLIEKQRQKWYYEMAEKAGTCKIHDRIREEQIPEEVREARRKSKGIERAEEVAG